MTVFRRIQEILLSALVLVLFFSTPLRAQSSEPALRGQVTDPSSAAIPAVTVTLTGPNGATQQGQTNEEGRYVFRHLASGTYTVRIQAKGFREFEKTGVEIGPGRPAVVDAQLVVAMETQQVTVQGESEHVSVSASSNVSAVVLKGEDLKALSDDPDELQDELQALAGPAAGPNGGQIYIDGFTGGQLPPKSSILEVRVNQNPFSAEYDKLGYGRIEITTKPGAQQFHGQVMADGNDSVFNSRNPFLAENPSYHSEFFNGNLGGPLGKKASFFLDSFPRNINDESVVDAVVLDPSFNQTSLSQAVPHPQTRTLVAPRVDFQLSNTNVMTVRYQYWHNDNQSNGVGQFDLPTQAYNASGTEHTLQVSDTQVVSARTVNQMRFQYLHDVNDQFPFSLDPALNVIGAFTGGGNSAGKSLDTQDHYELNNLTSMSLGRHNLTLGGRVRAINESQSADGGFNGTFTFPSLQAYQITEQGLAQGLTPTQIRAAGGGASQFSITAGNPLLQATWFDLGLYAEDEWRVRPNISLTAGLRFESQDHIQDHGDFAPRLGLAWGFGGGKTAKTVLRAGFGIFYDRFEEGNVLTAERLNGINQQRYVVNAPDFFPTVPSVSSLTGAATFPTVYQIDPTLRAPYVTQSAVGLERQVARNVTASVTYINTHGVHQFLTRNINAPLPGTYNPSDPTSGVRPFGNVGNIYQYESDGLFNQNQLIANFNVRAGTRLSLFGFYTLSYADSNTNGISSFPMNQYDIGEDYGPAGFNIRHRAFVGGSIGLPKGFRIMPFMVATSGHPYNITLGQDLNGDSIFNDRPAFAAPGATGPGIVATPFGTFNTLPQSGEPLVPINYLVGPGQFSMNMRLAKTFSFGKSESSGGGRGGWHGGGPRGSLGGRGLSGGIGGPGFWGGQANRRYSLEFSLNAHNVFNHVNLGTPVGNLSSPLFGQSNSIAGGFFSSQAANRRLDLMVRFSF